MAQRFTYSNRAGRVRDTGMTLCRPGDNPAPILRSTSGAVILPPDSRPAIVVGRSPMPRKNRGNSF